MMNSLFSLRPLLTASCLLLISWGAAGQSKVQQKLPEKTRILFLLDASGSMQEQWEKNQTKWGVAKSILARLVDSLKQNNQLELGLRVYGHRSPQEQKNCKDTWLEVPFKSKNHPLIISKLQEIKPKGVTPITYSLEQAAKAGACIFLLCEFEFGHDGIFSGVAKVVKVLDSSESKC